MCFKGLIYYRKQTLAFLIFLEILWQFAKHATHTLSDYSKQKSHRFIISQFQSSTQLCERKPLMGEKKVHLLCLHWKKYIYPVEGVPSLHKAIFLFNSLMPLYAWYRTLQTIHVINNWSVFGKKNGAHLNHSTHTTLWTTLITTLTIRR